MGLAIFLAVMVAVGGWTAWKRVQTRAREDQIPAMAASKGLQFARDDPFNSKVLAFKLFQAGDGSRLENVVWNGAGGDDGDATTRAFDFGWYQVRHDRGREYEEWHWSTCALAQAGGSWPALQITHQGLLEKAIDLAQGDPIRFESEEFNQTFHVSCEDRRFASALIDPQMMQFLLETKGLVSFATLGRYVLLTCPQGDPVEMSILLGLADAFVHKVPNAAWELYPKTTPVDGAADAPPGARFAPTPDAVGMGDSPEPDDAWDPTPGVDYDLDGHPVQAQTEDPWHDHPVRPHDDG